MPKNEKQQEMQTRIKNVHELSHAMTSSIIGTSGIGTSGFRAAFQQEATRLETLVTDISNLQSALNENHKITAEECANLQKYIDTTNKRIDAMADLLNATLEGVKKYQNPLKAGAMESVFAVNAMLNGIVMESQNNQSEAAKKYFDQSKTFAERAEKLDILAVQGGKSYALETLTLEEFNVLNNDHNIKKYLKDATANNYRQVIFNKIELDKLKGKVYELKGKVYLDKKILSEKLVEGKEEELSSGFRQAICIMMDVLVAIPVFCIALVLATMGLFFGMFMPELVVAPIAGAVAIVGHVDDLIKEAASETEHLEVLKEVASLGQTSLSEPKDPEENNTKNPTATSPNLNTDTGKSDLKEKIQALKEKAVAVNTSPPPQNKM